MVLSGVQTAMIKGDMVLEIVLASITITSFLAGSLTWIIRTTNRGTVLMERLTYKVEAIDKNIVESRSDFKLLEKRVDSVEAFLTKTTDFHAR